MIKNIDLYSKRNLHSFRYIEPADLTTCSDRCPDLKLNSTSSSRMSIIKMIYQIQNRISFLKDKSSKILRLDTLKNALRYALIYERSIKR